MSDYLAKEIDSTKAKLGEDAEKSKDEGDTSSKGPKLSRKKESESLGKDTSKQRVITYDQLQEEKKRTKAFRAATGELQQEV
ncbi:MAG: hypothetical protein ACYC9U_08920 [Nitrososphaerales archaeon]